MKPSIENLRQKLTGKKVNVELFDTVLTATVIEVVELDDEKDPETRSVAKSEKWDAVVWVKADNTSEMFPFSPAEITRNLI